MCHILPENRRYLLSMASIPRTRFKGNYVTVARVIKNTAENGTGLIYGPMFEGFRISGYFLITMS